VTVSAYHENRRPARENVLAQGGEPARSHLNDTRRENQDLAPGDVQKRAKGRERDRIVGHVHLDIRPGAGCRNTFETSSGLAHALENRRTSAHTMASVGRRCAAGVSRPLRA
jgi:hypothetical protein